LYVRGEKLKELKPNVSNLIFGLTETGESGDTEECIERVLRIKKGDRDLFYELDSNMDEASKGIAEALESGDKELLIKSFDLASSVFESWGLVTSLMKSLMEELKEKGALAVKPTGSGMGGYVLSVWSKSDKSKFDEYCLDTFFE
jgi:mevalonate kinase